MNVWLVFALLSPICWGFSNALDGAVRRHFVKNDYATTWFLGITRLPVLVVLALFLKDFHVPGAIEVMGMLAAGFLWIFPFILYYRSIEFEETSLVVILLQLLPIFSVLVAYTVLGETLTKLQLIAFMLLFIGGLCASVKSLQGRFHLSKALPLMLIASLLWATSDVIYKKYAPAFGDFWNSFFWYLVGGFVFAACFILFQKGRRIVVENFSRLSRRGWIIFSIDQLIGITGSLFMAYALNFGKVSLTVVIMGIQPLVAFAATFLLRPIINEIPAEDVGTSSLVKKTVALVFILAGLLLLQQNA
ncbi:MAG: Conserved hypothetical membrane protein, DUF6 family [Candidatus Peregrinibacteria bacterium GW2011_GWA2_47_7]|nr:MAG: Conserved hypothetical membrane protein, DUF6 family [Candidatus Peregrinibacteria bacterium GW2011_GWA2_47_7]